MDGPRHCGMQWVKAMDNLFQGGQGSYRLRSACGNICSHHLILSSEYRKEAGCLLHSINEPSQVIVLIGADVLLQCCCLASTDVQGLRNAAFVLIWRLQQRQCVPQI